MLTVSKEDRAFLKMHIENVDELINQNSRKPLLSALFDIIMYKGFDKDGFYNRFGREAQLVYDRIRENNLHLE